MARKTTLLLIFVTVVAICSQMVFAKQPDDFSRLIFFWWLIFIPLGLVSTVFWAFMLTDCIIRKLKNKTLWIVILIVVPLGWMVYYLVVARNKPVGKIPKSDVEKYAQLGGILGLVALVSFFGFGIALGLPAIILSKKLKKQQGATKDSWPKVGFICGILAIIAQVAIFGLYFGFITYFVLLANDGQLSQADRYAPTLKYEHAIVGFYDDVGEECIPHETKLFSEKDDICVVPINVTSFASREDQFSEFEMDLEIVDASSQTVYLVRDIWEKDGLQFLRYGVLNPGPDHFVIAQLDRLKSGQYTIMVTVRDEIARKSVQINESFSIK